MNTSETSTTCRGLTEGWCARVGLARAFEANGLCDDTVPYHLFQEKRDAAAEFIGRGGCAEFAPTITKPEAAGDACVIAD